MVLMEFSVVPLNGIFELSWYVGMVVFLESLLTLSNVYEKVKILEIIESRKPRGNTDHSFGLKKLFSYISISDKFLA